MRDPRWFWELTLWFMLIATIILLILWQLAHPRAAHGQGGQIDCNRTVSPRSGGSVMFYPEHWHPTPWHLDRIDQANLPLDQFPYQNGGRGGWGEHVYVVDTGIDSSHEEFAGRIGWSWSAV